MAHCVAGLGGRSLLAVVDQSARAGGLGNAIKRIEPDGTVGDEEEEETEE